MTLSGNRDRFDIIAQLEVGSNRLNRFLVRSLDCCSRILPDDSVRETGQEREYDLTFPIEGVLTIWKEA